MNRDYRCCEYCHFDLTFSLLLYHRQVFGSGWPETRTLSRRPHLPLDCKSCPRDRERVLSKQRHIAWVRGERSLGVRNWCAFLYRQLWGFKMWNREVLLPRKSSPSFLLSLWFSLSLSLSHTLLSVLTLSLSLSPPLSFWEKPNWTSW